MAKRLFVVLAILSLATAAFASGQNEKDLPGVFQGDKLALKGIVSFQAGPQAILKSGDKQYLLMVPPYLVYSSGVKEGAQVAVQGYQLRYPPRAGWSNGNTNLIGLFVTQATVDGKDYDLSRYYGAMIVGGRGPGYGPMGGGYGPRGGPSYGPGYGSMGPGFGYGMMGRGYGPGRGMRGPGGDWDDQ
jgi:hypothetical protein